jgi:hypothetical protein
MDTMQKCSRISKKQITEDSICKYDEALVVVVMEETVE